MSIPQDLYEVRMAALGQPRPANPFNREYGGMTAFTVTGGYGSTEEGGGHVLAVDTVSDEYEVRGVTHTFLDTPENRAMVIAATGGKLLGSAVHVQYWYAQAGTDAGRTPSAREYGPIEVSIGNATLTVGTPNGGTISFEGAQHGPTPPVRVIA